MRARDILIVAAVLLVGGFAAADALRGDTDSAAPATTEAASTEVAEPDPVTTLESFGEGKLDGRLLFTDSACSLGELDLTDGTRERIMSLRTSCAIVAPLESTRTAVSLPSRFRGVTIYRVVDVEQPEPPLASFRARIQSVAWSLDGSLVAWCEPAGRGLELDLELATEPRRLSGCPVAYTHRNEPVYVRGRRVVIGNRTTLHAPGRVREVSFSVEGSAGVATARRLQVFGDADTGDPVLLGDVRLPPAQRGLEVRFAPTLCQAALLSSVFPPTPTVFVVDLQPCRGSRAPLTIPGRAAAWFPGGDQLAVAARDRVVVHTVIGEAPAVELELEASALAWKTPDG